MADEPVSRILYGAALAGLHRDDHSSSPGLAAGIQQPTRGFILPRGLRRTKGSAFLRTNSVSRASSPLLFGLAPRGVCRAPDVATGAVGSYPTFSPLPALRTIRRCPEGFPPGYHRDTLRRRYILCGTFRDVCRRRVLTRPAAPVPWRYQARCPTSLSRSGVRTFLPPSRLRSQASDRPAHPPLSLYPVKTMCNRFGSATSCESHFAPTNFSNSCSVRMATPNSFALSYFDPGSVPTTT